MEMTIGVRQIMLVNLIVGTEMKCYLRTIRIVFSFYGKTRSSHFSIDSFVDLETSCIG